MSSRPCVSARASAISTPFRCDQRPTLPIGVTTHEAFLFPSFGIGAGAWPSPRCSSRRDRVPRARSTFRQAPRPRFTPSTPIVLAEASSAPTSTAPIVLAQAATPTDKPPAASAPAPAAGPAAARACRGGRHPLRHPSCSSDSHRILHAKLRRHRLDADVDGARAHDDRSPVSALFYGGMVRKKNVGDTVMTSFAICCLITVIFACLTYSAGVHDRADTLYRRDFSRLFLQGVSSAISRRASAIRTRSPRRSPRPSTCLLPDDLRDHHPGTHRRRLRGTHEVLRDAVVHRHLGDRRLRAGRSRRLGFADGIFSAANVDAKGNFTGSREGSRLRRRHGRPHQRRRCRSDVPPSCSGKREKTPALPTTWC